MWIQGTNFCVKNPYVQAAAKGGNSVVHMQGSEKYVQNIGGIKALQ